MDPHFPGMLFTTMNVDYEARAARAGANEYIRIHSDSGPLPHRVLELAESA